MLVNGEWQAKWQPFQKTSDSGEFIRQQSSIRHWVSAKRNAEQVGEATFIAEKDRYHLYLAFICPWASRVLMTLYLKGLENCISVSIVNPVLTEYGWQFNTDGTGEVGATEDHINQFHHLYQLYTHSQHDYTGRATVPVLWDKKLNTMVNNESADIIAMLNSEFEQWATHDIDLRPTKLIPEIEALNDYLYNHLNNGVYRAGFAQSQNAYEEAVLPIFSAMDEMESRLTKQQYLLGNELTESDVRLFVTLIRFDLAYFGLFKCNIRACSDYPALSRYIRDIYQLPNIALTVSAAHIKKGYYSVKALNPLGIVPMGANLTWLEQ
ncbi:glutathione S-transferase family protein [Colwelliaceae bacterium 6441]